MTDPDKAALRRTMRAARTTFAAEHPDAAQRLADAAARGLRAQHAAGRGAGRGAGAALGADLHLAHADHGSLFHLVRLLHGAVGVGVGGIALGAGGEGEEQGERETAVQGGAFRQWVEGGCLG